VANITFEELVSLVDHLTPQEQTDLTAYLLKHAQQRQLSVHEKWKLLRAVQVDVEVNEAPSVRREDW
jgi:alpha-D-ribose 1-methylphosphonate 5-triphosphate diphosphatase PhnM